MSRRKDWVLGQEAFEKLLGTLDPDRDRAAQKYESLWRRLVQIFQWRGCLEPEGLADETFDRVSRRLEEGEKIQAAEPSAYFYGVARNVLKEYWTTKRNERRLEGASPMVPSSLSGAQDLGEREIDEHLDCLDRCLARLPRESRTLITEYYRWEKRDKIAGHARLGKSLGLSPGALRIKVLRIRRLLERQVNECIKKKSDG